MKTSKRPRTRIIEHEEGYHINFNREDGFSALIDSPYFSANCLGYFETKDAARLAVSTWKLEHEVTG